MKFTSIKLCLALFLSFSVCLNSFLPPVQPLNYLAAASILQKLPPKDNSGHIHRTFAERKFRQRRTLLKALWITVKAGAVLGPSALLAIGCSKDRRNPPLPAPPPPQPPMPQLSIEEHADWVLNQIDTARQVIQNDPTPRNSLIGLIKSFEASSDPFLHVYNQALGVVALLIAEEKVSGKGYGQAAKNILTVLEANQNGDGSFSSSFHLTDPTLDLIEKQTGSIAFVGLAINLYTLKTNDTQFVPMGERIADYLVANAVTRPSFPGTAVENGPKNALSGEENVAVYSFLNEFANITTNSVKSTQYRNTASGILQFIENLWDDSQGRFNQGRNSGGAISGNYSIIDTGYAADMQTSTVMALGNTSSNGLFNYIRGIDPNQPNSIQQRLGTSNPEGIAFSEATLNAGIDAAQTSRFANALTQAKNRNNSLSGFDTEATAQLVNAEVLSIQSSPGQTGTNQATGVSGTHGGVILVLRNRDQFIGPNLGPSVEATVETMIAKAGVNFYGASQAVTQFSSIDSELQKEIFSRLQENDDLDIPVAKSWLSQALGKWENNHVFIQSNHLTRIWKLILKAFNAEEREKWFGQFTDFILGVVHHEAVVHPQIEKVFNQMNKRKIDHTIHLFLFDLRNIRDYAEFMKAFESRFMMNRQNGNERVLTEELLAQIFSYILYPEGSPLKFIFSEYKTKFEQAEKQIQKNEELLSEFNSIDEQIDRHITEQLIQARPDLKPLKSLINTIVFHFPELKDLIAQERHIAAEAAEKRKVKVISELDRIQENVRFINREEILSLQEPILVEASL